MCDLRYMRDDDGQLVVARVKPGRAEFAEISEEGVGEWMVVPMGEPAMN